MRRVTDPLELMGAVIETTDGHLPLTIKQGVTKPLVNYTLPVASAQVKSSLLLAGLTSGQAVSIHEPELSRDHTEYFLQRIFQGNQSFWITDSDTSSRCLQLKANAKSAFPDYLGVFEIPDDPSSMAFWCVLAALVPDAQITFHRASLNPTRIGFIDILRQSGCQISRTRSFSSSRTQLWEPQGELCIDYAKKLKPFTITPTEVPSLIDEVPILMALAATIPGTSSIRGAAELRKKESDRIACVAANLRRLGAKVTEYDDGMDVTGTETLKATEMLTTHGDHRLAMAWLVLCAARAPGAMIDDVSCAAVSYPTFLEELPLKSS